MGATLRQRLGTDRAFPPGEELMLALSLAAADLGAFPESLFRRHGLTHTQYNILRMLRGAGSAGMLHGQITARLILGVPDVTRLVDGLERRGLVRRTRLRRDRRKVKHHLTAAGLDLLERIGPDLDRFHAWLAAALPRDAAEHLVASCERLIDFAKHNSPWEEEHVRR